MTGERRPTIRQLESAILTLMWLHEHTDEGGDRDQIRRVRRLLGDELDGRERPAVGDVDTSTETVEAWTDALRSNIRTGPLADLVEALVAERDEARAEVKRLLNTRPVLVAERDAAVKDRDDWRELAEWAVNAYQSQLEMLGRALDRDLGSPHSGVMARFDELLLRSPAARTEEGDRG